MIFSGSRILIRKLFESTNQILFRNKTNVRYSSNASEVFKNHGVVPEIIPVAPKELLKVTFPSGATADGGNDLTPTQVKDPPKINFQTQSSHFNLLCLTDPDSPSRGRPTYREWHHWLVGNIPGDDVSKGEILSDYISPCPPRTSGKHRYIFLVYKQGGKLTFDEPRLGNKRSSNREYFSIKKFAEKYKLGNPIAGNLFLAEWDEYVEQIYENLSKL
ncbi:protein D3-like [Episyrphus balteatus]|uniref:protein D3-like n=1 Tax=Episyrphus balteatus TaxID=286459 RepID=UPI002485E097|nr:protein D3-like [Episyrphus balteatus]